jgi:hypothetical protein
MKNEDITAEAERIASAIHELNDREQGQFLFTLLGACILFTLLGACIVSSPETIVSASRFAYGDIKEKLEKALDANA